MLHFIQCRIKWNPRMMSDDQSDSREDGSDEQGKIEKSLSLKILPSLSAHGSFELSVRETCLR